MSEKFLHYIWQNQLFETANLETVAGESLEVLYAGDHNTDAGPDFLNARIRINGQEWIGSVEVHVKSSDWFNHKHHEDKTYDMVILHVVNQVDKAIYRQDGYLSSTLQIPFEVGLHEIYQRLEKPLEKELPCRSVLIRIDPLTWSFWLERLLVERLERKTKVVLDSLLDSDLYWDEAFYQTLGRNLGFKLNALPFDMLVRSLPLKAILKHKNNLKQIEAMLFGQGGFLEDPIANDAYHAGLCDEYRFLKKKFQLTPIDQHLWKFMRLRPVNFPTIRLAQFAVLLQQSSHLFSKIIDSESIADIKPLFEVSPSAYWDTHYRFGKESSKRSKCLGKSAFEAIVINTIVPMLFVYGKTHEKEKVRRRALSFLETLPAEKNRVVRPFAELGIEIPDAYHSQALIELKTQYCDRNRCLDCRVAYRLLQTQQKNNLT